MGPLTQATRITKSERLADPRRPHLSSYDLPLSPHRTKGSPGGEQASHAKTKGSMNKQISQNTMKARAPSPVEVACPLVRVPNLAPLWLPAGLDSCTQYRSFFIYTNIGPILRHVTNIGPIWISPLHVSIYQDQGQGRAEKLKKSYRVRSRKLTAPGEILAK